jgi:hypothetical protein
MAYLGEATADAAAAIGLCFISANLDRDACTAARGMRRLRAADIAGTVTAVVRVVTAVAARNGRANRVSIRRRRRPAAMPVIDLRDRTA